MKININKLNITPKSISKEFQLSVFNPDEEIKDWVNYHNFENYLSKGFFNVKINKPLKDIFLENKPFDYIDGFSPNLNKKLHIGHFSNLVLAKSFVNLGIANELISIYGDTLEYGLLKSKFNLNPGSLFFGLVEYCKIVNNLYSELKIKDNEENKKLFNNFLANINYCSEKLGLFLIDKV